jgi:hypothetical protein
MPFFTVKFDLKTKMPSTVINKKILKLIFFLLKKKNLTRQPPPLVEGVAREPPPEVAPATSGVARGPPRPKGWPHGHPRTWGDRAATLGLF